MALELGCGFLENLLDLGLLAVHIPFVPVVVPSIASLVSLVGRCAVYRLLILSSLAIFFDLLLGLLVRFVVGLSVFQ